MLKRIDLYIIKKYLGTFILSIVLIIAISIVVDVSEKIDEFMENNDYFTVSFYDEKFIKQMGYLGSKSGRNTNKVKDVDFHPIEVNNSVTFEEAYCTVVCKKYYYTDINKDNVPSEDINRYYLTEEPHRVYYGEIIEVVEK